MAIKYAVGEPVNEYVGYSHYVNLQNNDMYAYQNGTWVLIRRNNVMVDKNGNPLLGTIRLY